MASKKAPRTPKARPPAADGKAPRSAQTAGAKKTKGDGDGREVYHLRLYVAGQSRKSLQAVANLREICEIYLSGRYSIEVVDLLQHPQLARADQILAIPTLVRKLPEPMRKIIGDLSNRERVLVGLDVEPGAPMDGQ